MGYDKAGLVKVPFLRCLRKATQRSFVQKDVFTMSTYWKRIQKRLDDLGFDPGPIDGIEGPKTNAAIVAFKQSVGLRARPYVGPLTLKALFPVKNPAKEGGGLPWMNAAYGVLGLHEERNTSRLKRWFSKSMSW